MLRLSDNSNGEKIAVRLLQIRLIKKVNTAKNCLAKIKAKLDEKSKQNHLIEASTSGVKNNQIKKLIFDYH